MLVISWNEKQGEKSTIISKPGVAGKKKNAEVRS